MEKELPPFHASRMTTRKYLSELQNEGVISERKLGNGLASELYVNGENPVVILQQELEKVEACFRTLSRSLVVAINSNKSRRQDVEEEVCDILDGMNNELFTLMTVLIRNYVMNRSRQITNRAVLAKLHELILSSFANIEYIIIDEVRHVKGIEDYNRAFYITTERSWNDFESFVPPPKESIGSICRRLDLWDEFEELLGALYNFPVSR